MKAASQKFIRLARWWSSRWRGSKPTIWIKDGRGVATVVVALFLTVILLFLAILIDATGLFVRRAQMINATELGAAAGGRVVAEAVAYAAERNFPNPSEEQKEKAAAYLTPLDRAAIEDGSYELPGGLVRDLAGAEATKYVLVNAPRGLTIIPETDLNISYVPEPNDCADPDTKDVQIEVGLSAGYTFVFKNLLIALGLPGERTLAAKSTYNIVICP